jgi:hypothetical protein
MRLYNEVYWLTRALGVQICRNITTAKADKVARFKGTKGNDVSRFR